MNRASGTPSDRLNALRYSLQALAEPAEYQRKLLVHWREDLAELPERFVQSERHVRSVGASGFTAEQEQALAELHGHLNSFCGPAHAEHWKDEALDWSPHWMQVRRVASRCLETFGWPIEQPPLDISAYGGDYFAGFVEPE